MPKKIPSSLSSAAIKDYIVKNSSVHLSNIKVTNGQKKNTSSSRIKQGSSRARSVLLTKTHNAKSRAKSKTSQTPKYKEPTAPPETGANLNVDSSVPTGLSCLVLATNNLLRFTVNLALLAPGDNEHIYKAKDSEKKNIAKKKTQNEIPDDAPTVLKEIVHKERNAKQRSSKMSGNNQSVSKDGVDPKKDANSGVMCCCCHIM